MATRSTIALEFADGTVQSVYCHWDGYLEHVGTILQKHYLDPNKVRELIDLGNLSSLGPEIGVKHEFNNPHRYNSAEWIEWEKVYGNQCTFYGRDRDEIGEEARKFNSVDQYVKENPHQGYDYILRQIDNKPVWFVKTYDSDLYVSIEQAFAMMNTERVE